MKPTRYLVLALAAVLCPAAVPQTSQWMNPTDGQALVLVPAGPFTMGGDKRDQAANPPHQVDLPAFYIGRYEVTVAQFVACCRALNAQPDRAFLSHNRNDKDPVRLITWPQANAYCQWAGLRLPTEAEWEKAARGTDTRRLPWGNGWDSALLNSSDKGSKDPYVGVAPVGSFPGGASPYGCLDMAGNVMEWTSSLYFTYPYTAADGREDQNAGGERVLRGGSYCSGGSATCNTTARARQETGAHIWDAGFRCAISADAVKARQ